MARCNYMSVRQAVSSVLVAALKAFNLPQACGFL